MNHSDAHFAQERGLPLGLAGLRHQTVGHYRGNVEYIVVIDEIFLKTTAIVLEELEISNSSTRGNSFKKFFHGRREAVCCRFSTES